MTPARRAELIAGVEAALALEGGVLTGREYIEALLLWFVTSPPGLTVMDAIVAGYRVAWENSNGYRVGGYAARNKNNRVVTAYYGSQADAWRAALRHMAAQ